MGTPAIPNNDDALKSQISQLMGDLDRAINMSEQLVRLKTRLVGLEVDCIAAASAKKFRKTEDGANIPVETAAAIVLTLDRRRLASENLPAVSGQGDVNNGLLDSGRDALKMWLQSDDRTEARQFSTIVRGVLMLVSLAAIFLGIVVHWAFFIMLMPVAATSTLMWSGNDAHWKRMGAKSRFLSTGLSPPKEWNAGNVAKCLKSIECQLDASVRQEMDMTSSDEIEKLASELTELDNELDLLLASVQLDREDVDSQTEQGLRSFSAQFIASRDLRTVKDELKRLESDIEAIRNQAYRFLFRYNLAPEKGSADLTDLKTRLLKLSL